MGSLLTLVALGAALLLPIALVVVNSLTSGIQGVIWALSGLVGRPGIK